jgi:hypothetical protein
VAEPSRAMSKAQKIQLVTGESGIQRVANNSSAAVSGPQMGGVKNGQVLLRAWIPSDSAR